MKSTYIKAGILIGLLLIFLNIHSQTFTEQTGISLTGVRQAAVAWGDYDNDKDLDILLTGFNASSQRISKVYRNNGNNTFSIQDGIVLQGMGAGSVCWGDYDNDTYLDILMTGSGTTIVYQNNGDNTFSRDWGITLPGLSNGSVDWGDYDNDGDLDIILSGSNISAVYKNNGDKTFTEQTGIDLPGLTNSNVAWGDYDSDGDLDIFIGGNDIDINRMALIYQNNGDNSFTKQTDILLAEATGKVDWGDYDNDGHLDLVLSGNGFAKIYKNDGAGNFVEQTGISLTGDSKYGLMWGDKDNDGDLDILISGNYQSRIYENNGDNTFTEMTGISLPGGFKAASSWGDYDKDGDLDILLTGEITGVPVTKIYRNDHDISNNTPTIPTDISAVVNGNDVTFQWENSTDNETPQNGLGYSLRVSAGMGSEITSPLSDLNSGERKVVEAGKIRRNTWTMKIRKTGTYSWFVQSIDHNFKGSAYSEEGTFVVSFANSIAPTVDQTLLPGVDGTALTVSESLPAGSRQWMYSRYPGGPYTNVIGGATGASYTPNATDFGYYYVVCVSTRSGASVTSNEVKIEIPQFTHLTNLEGVGNSSVAWGDYDNDGNLDILLTGGDISRIYRNNGNSTFTEQAGIVLTGVDDGSVDWGDYDNDGDLDILLTGENSSEGIISKIYMNNGDNTFTEQSLISLTGVVSGAAKWADYDTDGDLDILLSGRSGSSSQVFKLYRNEGLSQFTDVPVNIPPFSDGDMSLADYDKDGDLDILLAGWDYSGNIVTKIYRNDGAEKFRNARAGLTGAFESAVAWGDYDNDGDLDILLAGNDGQASSARITTIYVNNGDGSFSELSGTSFKQLGSGTANWGDYDNDGDLDILLSGYDSEIKSVTVVYKNNGDHSFTEDSNINLIDLNRGSADWGDYDNDGDLDILLTGNFISRIYRNNAVISNTAPSIPTNLKAKSFARGAILSWDKSTDAQTPGDGLTYNAVVSKTPGGLDVLSPHSKLNDGFRLITGIGNASHGAGKWISNIDTGLYYWGVQAIDQAFKGSKFSSFNSFVVLPEYTDIEAVLPGVRTSSCVWGDYDNDGDLDFLLSGATGYFPNYNPVTRIYNNEDNVFSEIPVVLENVLNSAAAWGDYDNDGDLDFVITGLNESGVEISKLYKNNGGNSFAEENSISLEGIDEGAVAWGDYNNDGYLDLLLAGRSENGSVSHIYKNNGDGDFMEDANIVLTGVSRGDVAWGDYNNDGYLDIILTGNSSSGMISKIYKNMGDGTFEEQTNIMLTKVYDSSVAWGDYDNDGFLDLILTGASQAGNISEIYKNMGDGSFEEQTDIFIRGISGSSVMWGDSDNDGDLDILFAGSSGTHITEIYRNMGESGFTEVDIGVSGASSGSTGFGDYDDDGDLDIIVSGWNSEDNFFSKIYRSNIDRDLINPGIPGNLQSEESGLGIILSWDMSVDGTMPQYPQTYNLRVGSTPGGVDIVSPMSDLTSGKLMLPKMGNCNLNYSWQLDSLPQGDYYWSVQAVDQSYEGGTWAPEEMFSISLLNAGFGSDTVCVGQPTNFDDQTVNAGTDINKWEWDFGDGNTSDTENTSHTYDDAGTYYVTLIVNSDESVDSVTQEVVVKGKPIVNFVSDVACHGEYTNFQNTSQPNGTVIESWHWNFDDGAISELEEPLIHGYLNIGEYYTRLMATSDDGCIDSIRKTVRVTDYPEAGISIAGDEEFCAGDSTKLSVTYNSDYAYNWRRGKNKITGADSSVFYASKTGRYTVSVINRLGGCVTHSGDTVDILAKESPPDPTILSSGYSSSDCPQENVITLSVEQPSVLYTYQWYRNGAPIDGESKSAMSGLLDEAEYTVTVSNGICEIGSEIIDIYFDRELPPKPGIEVQGSNIWYLACTNTEADVYEWYYNNEIIAGANEYLYVADQNLGTYVVRIKEDNGCMVSSDAVTIPQTTGIKEADIWEHLKIYPNPTPGLFTLEMDNHLMGELIIDIFGDTGSKIINIKFQKETAHFKTQIDLSEQPAGAYLIGLMLDKYRASRTLIVE